MQPYCPNNSNFTFREVVCLPCKPRKNCHPKKDDFFDFDNLPNMCPYPKMPCQHDLNQINMMPPHLPCPQKIAPSGCNFWTFMSIWCFLERSSNYPTHLTLDQ